MDENKKEAHLCPVLGRIVIFMNNECIEPCKEEDCPVNQLIYYDDLGG